MKTIKAHLKAIATIILILLAMIAINVGIQLLFTLQIGKIIGITIFVLFFVFIYFVLYQTYKK